MHMNPGYQKFGNSQMEGDSKSHWVGQATIDYHINDFNINELPEDNPLQMIIEDFTSRRVAFLNKKNQG